MIILQLARGNSGTTPTAATYVGPIGEGLVDTDLWQIRVQDGTTPGGHLTGGSGTVTSVDVSGGSTGLTTSGGPITTSGTITVSGTLNVAHGGTGNVALTAHSVLLGEGTSPIAFATIGTAGRVLTDQGAGVDPVFAAPAPAPYTLDPVTTGTSHTVTLTSPGTITYWSSATSGAKTTHIPGAGAGNSGYEWTDKTTLNNGDVHNIIPASGTIDGQGTITFSDFRTALTMISDGSSNWMIV
jgi:hypothetical protein